MIGARIKELRREKQLTQEALGKSVGVSTSMIGMYETDARQPSYEVLKKMADFFGVSTDYLLGVSDIRNPIETLAAYRTDGYDEDLPAEAQEELKQYIEFLKLKYRKEL